MDCADNMLLSDRGHLMEAFVKDVGSVAFQIDTLRLVECMLDYFKRHAPAELQWLADARDPHESICNFLATTDGFLTSRIPACRFNVQLSAHYSYPSSLSIKGTLAWCPPVPAFLNLQSHVIEGTELLLSPVFHEIRLSDKFKVFDIEIQHHVGSDDLNLVWDRALQSYRARVPTAAERQPWLGEWSLNEGGPHQHLSYIDVTTVAVKHFPAGVRFERVMRCRLSVVFVPQAMLQRPVPSFASSPGPYSSAARVPTAAPDDSLLALRRVRAHEHHDLRTPRSAPILRHGRRDPVPTIREPAFNTVRADKQQSVLREVSPYDARVQGIAKSTAYDVSERRDSMSPVDRLPLRSIPALPSDFEMAARGLHPDVFATYNKASESRQLRQRRALEETDPRWAPVPRTVTVGMAQLPQSLPKRPGSVRLGKGVSGNVVDPAILSRSKNDTFGNMDFRDSASLPALQSQPSNTSPGPLRSAGRRMLHENGGGSRFSSSTGGRGSLQNAARATRAAFPGR